MPCVAMRRTTNRDHRAANRDERAANCDERAANCNERAAHRDERAAHRDERAAHGNARATNGNERATDRDITCHTDVHANSDGNRDEESVGRARDLRGFGDLEGLFVISEFLTYNQNV